MTAVIWRSVHVLGFALAASATAALLQLIAPWRDAESLLTRKLQDLKSRQGQINTIMLGSSRVYRHIDPAVFDATGQQAGYPMRSFNMGIDATFAPEDSYNLEQVAATGVQVDWVILEVNSFLHADFAQPGYSQRLVSWHDWPRTVAELRFWWPRLKESRKPRKWREWLSLELEEWPKKWPQLYGHAVCFWERSVCLGQGARLLQRALKGGPDRPEPYAEYLPLHDALSPQEAALLARNVAAARAQPVQLRFMPPEEQRNWDRMVQLVRQMGAQPVALIPPAATTVVSVPLPDPKVPVLNFCSVEKYPALFTPGHHRDHGHLNAAGAAIFSRLLAEEFVRRENDGADSPRKP